jgi:GH25 family lysozyme M1 (1,4-beta-N-acetylmuramidase)
MFSTYMEYAKSQHKLVGIYFFTNTNTWTKRNPEEYADWCIENTKDYLGYAVYALDCEEAEVLDCEWILRYLRRFQERTGVKPVLYTYQALLNRSDLEGLATIRSESYGLWIANYGDNDGSVTEFGVVKWEENKVFAHQYVSKPEHLCRDIFFCTPEAWYKFAKTNKTPT